MRCGLVLAFIGLSFLISFLLTKAQKNAIDEILRDLGLRLNYLRNLEVRKEEVIKMTKTIPAIFSYSIENIKQKIEDMISLGYTKEEVIKMTKTSPSIYSYSIEKIKQYL